MNILGKALVVDDAAEGVDEAAEGGGGMKILGTALGVDEDAEGGGGILLGKKLSVDDAAVSVADAAENGGGLNILDIALRWPAIELFQAANETNGCEFDADEEGPDK